MRATFVIGFVLGCAGLLAGAWFYPVARHLRVDSLSSVVVNGGRSETFMIRLPADRIAVAGTATYGPRASAQPAGLRLPGGLGAADLLVEHFKLRDADGRVIGIATHHATTGPDGAAAAWLLDIPGRGSLLLAGEGPMRESVVAQLGAAGYRPGVRWAGELYVGPLRAPANARIVGGTEEFAGVEGEFRETWQVTSVSGSGAIQGTVELETLVNRSS